jgi:hypothetical protein
MLTPRHAACALLAAAAAMLPIFYAIDDGHYYAYG